MNVELGDSFSYKAFVAMGEFTPLTGEQILAWPKGSLLPQVPSMNLASLIRILDFYEVDYENVRFCAEYEEESFSTAVAVFTRLETDEEVAERKKEWQKKQENYKKRLSAYNKWYNENKDAIEKELAIRDSIAKEKKKRDIEKLEAKLAELKKD